MNVMVMVAITATTQRSPAAESVPSPAFASKAASPAVMISQHGSRHPPVVFVCGHYAYGIPPHTFGQSKQLSYRPFMITLKDAALYGLSGQQQSTGVYHYCRGTTTNSAEGTATLDPAE